MGYLYVAPYALVAPSLTDADAVGRDNVFTSWLDPTVSGYNLSATPEFFLSASTYQVARWRRYNSSRSNNGHRTDKDGIVRRRATLA